jgi:WD40 repeat protein
MPIPIQCPNPACGKMSVAPDSLLGKSVRCKKCGQSFVTRATSDGGASETHPADASTAVPTPAVSQVGRFQIRRHLGEGAFGTVYLAHDPQLDRAVAVKVPHTAVLTNPKRVERFLREARAAAQLRHPHIVPVFETGTEGGTLYIASAFVEGKPLTDTYGEGGTEFPRAVRLVRELCEALAYAHDEGIVHRDVKPDNILVDAQDRVHLLDFGLASRQDDESRLTNDGAVMGTPSYMAPEQAAGNSAEAGPAADQYAAGVVLYELLTGTVPFEGPAAVVMHNAMHTPPDPPSKRRPGVPRDVETVCLKAMAKRPEDRYPDCQAVADDLRRWLEGEPITARRLSPVERLARWVRKNPAAASAGSLLVVVAGLVVVAVSLWGMYQNADLAKMEAVDANTKLDLAHQDTENQRKVAVEARDDLKKAQKKLARIQYGQAMQVAHQEWREGNVGVSRELLESSQKDLRGWEWNYLNRLCNTDILTLRGHSHVVYSASYTPDGKRIVTASADKTARIWDATTGAALLTLKGHASTLRSAAFNSDGAKIVTASDDMTARVWNSQTGVELLVLKGHTARINSAEYSLDGMRIVTGSDDMTARVWDAQTGVELRALKGHTSGVAAASFNADGKRIVTASGDRSARVWDAESGAAQRTLKGHSNLVQTAAFSPDGSRIVTAGNDWFVRLWDASTGVAPRPFGFRGHTHVVYSAAFSRNGSRIVTAGADRTARVWDAQEGGELLIIRGHSSGIHSAAFSPDAKRIVTASGDHTARVWDARTGPEYQVLQGPTGIIHAAAISPDGKQVAVGGGNQTVRVWNAETTTELFTLKGHADRILALAYSSDGKRLVTGSADNTARVWDTQTGNELLTLNTHTTGSLYAFGAAFSPDGTRVATSAEGRTARVWDSRTGAELLSLKGHTNVIRSIAYSPDGSLIATGGADHTARVWDAMTGAELLTLKGHSDTVATVSFCSDGVRLATGGRDRIVRVWNAKTGAEILTLKGHTDSITAASFSPDENGRRIVTASADGTTRVWDAVIGAELLVLKGHSYAVPTASFSPDGTRILAGTIIWDSRPFGLARRDRMDAEAAVPTKKPQ